MINRYIVQVIIYLFIVIGYKYKEILKIDEFIFL